MADFFLAGDIRNGMTLKYNGGVYQVIEFQHVKPGKGAAFVRTSLKNVIDGGVVENSFRPTEKFEAAIIERKDMQYLYKDGDMYYYMDTETYEQVGLTEEQVGDAMKFVKENEVCKVMSHEGKIFAIEAPNFVNLVVTYTEPGAKGNTATNTLKPATVETGAQVMVPLFIENDELIQIDTRTGEYLGRGKA